MVAHASSRTERITRLELAALTPGDLTRELPGLDLPAARRVVSLVHRGWRGGPLPGVPRHVQQQLRALGTVSDLTVRAERRSLVDPFRKLLLEAPDGAVVEAVRIPLERAGRFSVCVSSQVGCGLACAFCATGRLGLTRNLEAWEIVAQVRAVRATLEPARGERVHGVVFQGMGEPLANLDAVLQALRVLSDPCALAIDARAITVCTSGLPQGIRRLAREAPRVRLGVSLGSARPAVRERLMPITRAHPLDDVLEAVVDHARAARRAPLLALTLLDGITDTAEEAEALAKLVQQLTRRAGVRPRVSLIPYNSIALADDPFRRSEAAMVETFRARLAALGVPTRLRYSGGSDVAAACGQLAATREALATG